MSIAGHHCRTMSRGVITPDYYRHPKIRAAAKRSPLAVALDVACICWCADQLTDGIVEDVDVWRLLPVPRRSTLRAILVLEKVKRLDIASSTSWRVHGFLEHNAPADRVLARRRADAERKRRQRDSGHNVSRRDTWIDDLLDP